MSDLSRAVYKHLILFINVRNFGIEKRCEKSHLIRVIMLKNCWQYPFTLMTDLRIVTITC